MSFRGYYGDINRTETPGTVAGMGGGNSGLRKQWFIRPSVVRGERNHTNYTSSPTRCSCSAEGGENASRAYTGKPVSFCSINIWSKGRTNGPEVNPGYGH